jgi:hypothetical protein
MQANWKLLLSILMGLVIIGCMPPQSAPSRKIYFDLKSDPPVLVNELGVDIIIDRQNICYGHVTGLGWVPLSAPLSIVYIKRTPIFSIDNTNIRSGSSTPIFGACSAYKIIFAQDYSMMSAWMYQRLDQPKRRFAVYSDNVDPVNASPQMSVTTSVLASSPFKVKFQNTSDMTISVPLNCLVWVYPGDLAPAHLERQTAEAEEWEVFPMSHRHCLQDAREDWSGEVWMDIAPQMSGTVDMPRAYPADLTLEKGRYRWVTIFCVESPYNRNCYTSFSPTFDYAPEQTPQSP